MVMERTKDEIIIRFPADGSDNDIQEMVNYLNFKQIKTKKEISDSELESFANEFDNIIANKFIAKHNLSINQIDN